MEQTKKAGKFAVISALCYLALLVFRYLDIVLYSLSIVNSYSGFDYLALPDINTGNTFSVIVTITLMLTLFIRKKPAVIAIAIVMALVYILLPINVAYRFEICYIFGFLAYTALAIIILLSLKGDQLIGKIWSSASILMFFAYVSMWVAHFPPLEVLLSDFGYGYLSHRSFLDIVSFFKGILCCASEVVALFFAGLWAKRVPIRSNIIKDRISPHLRTAKRTLTYQKNSAGGADRLKVYKDLLDTGAITQEEFDERKRQILHSDE